MAQEIPKEVALSMVKNGEAGYYAVTVNHPVPHPTTIILMTQDRYFKLSSKELEMKSIPGEELGMQKDGPVFFNSHVITLHLPDESEISKLLKEEMFRYQSLKQIQESR